jgi:aldose sugar dehydrogenase
MYSKEFMMIVSILTILLFLVATFEISFAQNIQNNIYNITDLSIDPHEQNLLANEKRFIFNISTANSDPNNWNSIYGNEFEVNSNDQHSVISYLGVNSFAVQSHIVIEGYNNNTQEWEQVIQCPEGIDGPIELQRFVCNIEIDSTITKFRPVFKSGWSSEEEKEAITYFGKFFIVKVPEGDMPIVYDDNLKIQQVFKLSEFEPIVMDFLGQDDILVGDKTYGKIYRILNGDLIGPILDVNVAGASFFGLESVKTSDHTYVFIFYREVGEGIEGDDPDETIKPKCNCLYRYELINNTLVNPKLIFEIDLKGEFSPQHNGGVIRVGPDNNIYLITGEMDNNHKIIPNKARNIANSPDPDGSSGVLRFTIDGDPVTGILGDTYPLNLYYAYGIRNSFGMDFDPITGNLWDTENSGDWGDEINLVKPGFNSGYNVTEGIWNYNNKSIALMNPIGLVDFQGKGKYSIPEFTWERTVGPIALAFFNSTKLGNEYNNTMFVSDINNGFVYNFKLTENRTALDLVGPLEDKVANNTEELNSVIFASRLGVITDMKMGLDGFLYLSSFNTGTIYRIVPESYD